METVYVNSSRIKTLISLIYFGFFAVLFLIVLGGFTRLIFQRTINEFVYQLIFVWMVLVGLWLIELVLINACLLRLTELFHPQPRLTLDRRGINDRWLGAGTVEWVDIKRIELVGYNMISGIGLYVSDREKYVRRMNRWMRLTDRLVHPAGGGDALSIHYGCFKGSAQNVYKLIKKYRKARLHGEH